MLYGAWECSRTAHLCFDAAAQAAVPEVRHETARGDEKRRMGRLKEADPKDEF